MSDCCAANACEVEKLRDRQRSTLLLVLWINLVLFVVEGIAGVLASSIALLADALDMLGDGLIYGFSLYVVSRGALALAGNAWCLWLLWRHRAEDINMRSVWLCSRNDTDAGRRLRGG
jgi:Co/Zn/Cd efflux system component